MIWITNPIGTSLLRPQPNPRDHTNWIPTALLHVQTIHPSVGSFFLAHMMFFFGALKTGTIKIPQMLTTAKCLQKISWYVIAKIPHTWCRITTTPSPFFFTTYTFSLWSVILSSIPSIFFTHSISPISSLNGFIFGLIDIINGMYI